MSFYALRFNLYLLLAGVMLAGCQTDKQKKEKHLSSLRLHLESRIPMPDRNETVSVVRGNPVLVTVDKVPFLTESSILKAVLLETPGGYAIQVKFDEPGSLILEQYTSANQGRHFAIFSQWSEKTVDSRWIAAPIINHRYKDGVYSFTPDSSREEAEQIVKGLNNMAEKIAKGELK
jgi:preprotein translocase subunit SecD